MVETTAHVAVRAVVVKHLTRCECVQLMRSGESHGPLSGMRRPSLPLTERIIRMDKVPAAMLPQVASPVAVCLGAVLWLSPQVEAWLHRHARVPLARSLEVLQPVALVP